MNLNDPVDKAAVTLSSASLSEKQLHDLFDNTHDLIQSIALDGRILFVNHAWRETLGYSADEVATLNIFNVIHADCFDHCRNLFQRIMAGDHVGLIEVSFQAKDGRIIIVEGQVSLCVEDGQPIATRGIFRNINERKAAEAEILRLNKNLESLVTERTDELRLSERRFRKLVATVPGAVYESRIDATGHRSMPFISEGITDLIGYSPADCMADIENIFQQIPAAALPAINQSISYSLENDTPWLHEFPIYTKNGEKWLRGNSIPHRENDGSTIWHGVLVDITSQKLLEKTLRENERLFRTLAEISPVGIFRTNATGDCFYVNARWSEITGLSLLGAVARDSWTNALHPDDRERIATEWAHAVRHHQPFLSEYRFQSKSQKVIWVMGQAQTEHDENGVVVGYVGTITDITEHKQKEIALAESRNFLKAVVDTTPVRIFWKDRQSCYLGCNPAFAHDAGESSPENIIGKSDDQLVWKEQAGIYRNDDRQVMESGIPRLDYEEPQTTANGKTVWLRTSKVPLRNTDNEIIGILGIYQDITEQKQANESMLLANEIYHSSSEAIMVSDENNRIIQVNPAFTRMTGYELSDVAGKSPRIFRSGRHDPAFYQEMWQAIQNKGHWQGEIWDRRKDGIIHAKWLNISVIYRPDGRIYCYVAQFSDITEKKQKEELILIQANYDQLTMLPNRHLFKDRLDQAIRKFYHARSSLSVLFLDLDHFKDINDTLGHALGDKLLKEVGQRIRSCINETDTVARLGGDEFAVILASAGYKSYIEMVVQRIAQELSKPFKLNQDQIDYHISASIGIVLYPEDGTDAESLMKHADQAMYAAKQEGRDRFCYFTPSMQHTANEKMTLTNDLRKALMRNEMQVYYQPILDLSNRRIIKAEALLRWEHPQRGMINPDDFISLAEESGLILEIGEWVFDQSIAHIQHWLKQFGYIIQVSVNKSPIQFQQINKRAWHEVLTRFNLPGNCINVEITEGLLLRSSPMARNFLLEFRNKGIEVSIDDFGTGFSSLSYLKEFNIDYIKIDRSFISNLIHNTTDRALVEAMIVMAHKLDIKTIAEGVETNEQQDLLIEFGCDYVQGFLYSPPVPATEFEDLILQQ